LVWHHSIKFLTKVWNIIATQLGQKVWKFVCDGHSTYTSDKMAKLLEDDGTLISIQAPYCLEQNGLAKRQGKTTIKMACTLMIQSGVPANCWEDVLLHANYVHNHVPTHVLPRTTLFEKFWGKKPDLQW
jgi:hypothetical protein